MEGMGKGKLFFSKKLEGKNFFFLSLWNKTDKHSLGVSCCKDLGWSKVKQYEKEIYVDIKNTNDNNKENRIKKLEVKCNVYMYCTNETSS